MIFANDEVVQQWQTEATRALAAVTRATDPELAPALDICPSRVVELVVHLADALTHAAGVLAGSAVEATPGAPEVFREGLTALAREVAAEQERDLANGSADPGAVCPLPQGDGSPFVCGCGEETRAACARIAFEVGCGVVETPITEATLLADDQIARDGAAQLARDLDAVAADDRARRPLGDDGCEGGVA